MRKIFLLSFLIVSGIVNAQYKKATFFEKDGRTYEGGAFFHLLSNGRSTQNGFHFSFGKETERKYFLWYDLELTVPSKISTTGIRSDDNTVEKITGKSKLGFIFRYNLGYFFLSQKNEGNKINPFVKAGFNFKLGSSIKLDPKNENVSYKNFNIPEEGADGTLGFDFGIGTKIGLSENLSLRFVGGYNLQITGELFNNTVNERDRIFYPYISHPYLSMGIQFKINSKD
jgi:hypothetical protein